MEEFEEEYFENDNESSSGSRYRLKKRGRRKKTLIILVIIVCIIGGGAIAYSMMSGNEQAKEQNINQNIDKQAEKYNIKDNEPKDIDKAKGNNAPAEEPTAALQANVIVEENSRKKQNSNEDEGEQKTEEKEIKHKVKAGDSLFKLSKQYYNSSNYQEFLADYNNVKNRDNLIIGQTINIPFPPPSEWHGDAEDDYVAHDSTNGDDVKTHVVKKGETLYSISMKYYNSPKYQELLVKQNGLENPGALNVGDHIQIPSID